jgi:LmbE family N-acetylglucosaminyl deacetylase
VRRSRRRKAYTLIAVIVILAALAVVGRLLLPRAIAGARPVDVAAAKTAGDELLASRDATALIVVAHPDDTEWWAGGTAAMLARYNHVVLVVGTSGDKGDGGLVSGLGPIREKLQRQGGAIIGYREIVFLRNPDGGLGKAASFPGQVADLFAKFRPSIVLTFDVAREAQGYRHVDHEAAGRVTAAAAEKVGGITMYLFQTSAPDVIVDYGPVKEKKARAFAILTSYHDLAPIVGWFNVAMRRLGLSNAPVSYGLRASFPEVGVDFGEVFRKVVLPAR